MPTKEIMRGYRTYFAILSFLLLLAGCSKTSLERETIPDHCIELTIGNIHPSLTTKADHIRGDDVYNENRILSVDCFFYTTGHTDQDAVFMALGRGAEPISEGDSTVYKVKVYFTDADATAMFGSTDSGSCEAFVICNAPLSYTGTTSVAALRNLVMENDFSAQTVQNSFVMPAEEPVTVTLTTVDDVRSGSGRFNVRRSAAKMQLFLRIPTSFEAEDGKMWEPVLDAGIQVMMSNEVKRGKVDGAYTVQPADYVSTPYRRVYELDPEQLISGKEEYTYSHVPFYSYPTTWSDLSDYAPAIVFRIPWHQENSVGYIWRSYQLSPNMVGHALEANHYYRTFVTVSSLGGADKEGNVIIPDCDYVVLDWMNEGASAGGQGIVPGEIVTYKYMVVDHPNVVLNNEETALFTYVSSSPITSVAITKIVYYDYTQATPRKELTSGTDFDTAAETIDIDYSTPGLITVEHSLTDIYVPWEIYMTITNEDGVEEEIIVVQNPPIYMASQTGGNVFINGYFAHVIDAETDKGWIDRSSYYMSAGSGGYVTNDDNGNNITNYNYNNYTCIIQAGSYGTMPESTGFLVNLTQINITSFHSENSHYTINGSESYEYRIEDPREPSGWSASDLEQHLVSQTRTNIGRYTLSTSAWTNEQAGTIKVATTNKNSIAPSFYVSSGWGALGSTVLDYTNAQKRCATYQEGGFPAGRWRLPTEAEISYMFERQADGSIPKPFNASAYYWTSSGRMYNNGSYNSDRSTAFLRCIYDCWYWGTEPVEDAASKYTIMP